MAGEAAMFRHVISNGTSFDTAIGGTSLRLVRKPFFAYHEIEGMGLI
jgi:hypothetical protein